MPNQSGISALIEELRRRRVFRVAAFYGGIAFVIVQIIDGTFELMGVPAWVGRLMVVILGIGFPISMVFAWVFDITEEGIVRTKGRPPTAKRKAQPLIGNTALAIITIVAVMFGLWGQFSVTSFSDDSLSNVIAVLPLDNLGPDEFEYYADGMTEDLISELARLTDLAVISRTSVMQYKGSTKSMKEIGAELGAGIILEGSIRRSPDNIRIVAQLIDAKTDRHLWTGTYDMPVSVADIFAVQSNLAKSIASALHAQITGGEAEVELPTTNMAAYDALLKGHAMSASSLPRNERYLGAVREYKRATELDPGFGRAWAFYAFQTIDIYWEWNGETAKENLGYVPIARNALQHARELAPSDPYTQLAEGYFIYAYEKDWEGAISHYAKALAQMPEEPKLLDLYAYALRRMGKYAESITMLDKAIRLSPHDFNNLEQQMYSLLIIRDFESTLDMMDRIIRQYPQKHNAYRQKIFLYLYVFNDISKARMVLDEWMRSMPDPTINQIHSMEVGIEVWAGNFQKAYELMLSRDDIHQSFIGRKAAIALLAGIEDSLKIWQDDLFAEVSTINEEMRGSHWEQLILLNIGEDLAMSGDLERGLPLAESARAKSNPDHDHYIGPELLSSWFYTLSAAGRYDEASQVAEHLLSIPAYFTRSEIEHSPFLAEFRTTSYYRDLMKVRE